MDSKDRIQVLKEMILNLERQLPKHSVPVSMLVQIEDWEEELELLENDFN